MKSPKAGLPPPPYEDEIEQTQSATESHPEPGPLSQPGPHSESESPPESLGLLEAAEVEHQEASKPEPTALPKSVPLKTSQGQQALVVKMSNLQRIDEAPQSATEIEYTSGAPATKRFSNRDELRRIALRIPENNWPLICCFKPCFYQDIQKDIPSNFKRSVTCFYYLWMAYSITLLLNVIVGLIRLDPVITWMGIFYMLLLVPFTYVTCFRVVYDSIRRNSINLCTFSWAFFSMFVLAAVHSLGSASTNGIMTAMISLQKSSSDEEILYGVMEMLIGIMFACVAFADLVFVWMMLRAYATTGESPVTSVRS